jgi:hypothetical protein
MSEEEGSLRASSARPGDLVPRMSKHRALRFAAALGANDDPGCTDGFVKLYSYSVLLYGPGRDGAGDLGRWKVADRRAAA